MSPLMTESSVRQLLDRAWLARSNQGIDVAMSLLAMLRAKLHMPVASVLTSHDVTQLVHVEDMTLACDRVEVIALMVSLARARRDFRYSQVLLDALRSATQLMSLDSRAHYAMLQEAGLNAFAQGTYSQALECFVGARLYAVNHLHRYASAMNALLCFENLSLPSPSTYEDAKLCAAALAEEIADPLRLGEILSPLDLYDMRQSLLQGDVTQLLKSAETSGSAAFHDYQKLWLLSLPWHTSWRGDLGEEISQLASQKSYLFLLSYRIRTLLGQLDPDDRIPPRPVDAVERVYLWTWRWLTDPDKFPLHKVLGLLRDFDIARAQSKFAAQDAWQLRNSLLWLSLFDAGDDRKFYDSAQQLKDSTRRDAPLFAFERTVVLYLVARRDGDVSGARELMASLVSHKLWDNPHLLFKDLVLAVDGGDLPKNHPLEFLALTVKNLLQTSDEPLTSQVTVDLTRMKIWKKQGFDQYDGTSSELICVAFDFLRQRSLVTCEEFCKAVFQLRRYDSSQHDRRMFNLLARMRGLLPDDSLVFGVKQGKISIKGSWHALRFLGDTALSRDMRGCPLRGELGVAVSEAGQMEASTTNHKILSPKDRLLAGIAQLGLASFSRRDVEEILLVSKSTAGRILDDLVRGQAVERLSQGPRATYVFSVFQVRSTQTGACL
jgi:hypothetical protein